MTDLCQLLTKALDEEILEDPSVPVDDLWRLLITKYHEYETLPQGTWTSTSSNVIATQSSAQQVLLLVPQRQEDA